MSAKSDMDETLWTVKSGLLAYVLGDNEGLLELSHPECAWTFPGDPSILPWAGTFRAEEIVRFMERVKDSLDLIDHIPHTFLPIDPERVVVLSRDRARVKSTGRIFDHQLCALATVKDGKLYRWEEYGDTSAMERGFTHASPERGGPPNDAECEPPPISVATPEEGRGPATSRTNTPTVIQGMLASLRGEGPAEVLDLVHPDGHCFFPGDTKLLPWAGGWAGRELGACLSARKDALDHEGHGFEAFMPVDSTHVVVKGWERCRVKATGRVFSNNFIGIAQVGGGRVQSYYEYANTSAMERSFQPPR